MTKSSYLFWENKSSFSPEDYAEEQSVTDLLSEIGLDECIVYTTELENLD